MEVRIGYREGRRVSIEHERGNRVGVRVRVRVGIRIIRVRRDKGERTRGTSVIGT